MKLQGLGSFLQEYIMMDEPSIEAVRNRKNQKLFILVDDTLDMRYKVINPEGETLILPDVLFEEDPVSVPSSKCAENFSEIQLSTYVDYRSKEAEAARKQAERKPEPVRTTVVPPKQPPTPRKKMVPISTKRGLGASWSGQKLTFYKHKIEPLAPKQTFRVVLDGVGTFEITKEEFLAQFNDAVMSQKYRAEGYYTYMALPEKAKKYIK
jgi:hypothetical protein